MLILNYTYLVGRMEGSIARALLNERRAVEAEEKSPIFKNVVYAEDELMITIDESLKSRTELASSLAKGTQNDANARLYQLLSVSILALTTGGRLSPTLSSTSSLENPRPSAWATRRVSPTSSRGGPRTDSNRLIGYLWRSADTLPRGIVYEAVKVPEWSDLVKLGVTKDMAPVNPD
ncbi:hypothetical protein PRIPAC_84683 [Pristionchus pacificus]|uniref:Uncharacterized protein n=1 Tax=Pristionchus pacificus TaxID=54126 RepID=A0A2A6BIB4_PRIPA|nr:hypothetical protein PRIPAC_84683 [Pristionchus pacificus]|eukprot:PDM65627.1 hypothetical protein PRIPAC_53635 [Pristionchus pacificus]